MTPETVYKLSCPEMVFTGCLLVAIAWASDVVLSINWTCPDKWYRGLYYLELSWKLYSQAVY